MTTIYLATVETEKNTWTAKFYSIKQAELWLSMYEGKKEIKQLTK